MRVLQVRLNSFYAAFALSRAADQQAVPPPLLSDRPSLPPFASAAEWKRYPLPLPLDCRRSGTADPSTMKSHEHRRTGNYCTVLIDDRGMDNNHIASCMKGLPSSAAIISTRCGLPDVLLTAFPTGEPLRYPTAFTSPDSNGTSRKVNGGWVRALQLPRCRWVFSPPAALHNAVAPRI